MPLCADSPAAGVVLLLITELEDSSKQPSFRPSQSPATSAVGSRQALRLHPRAGADVRCSTFHVGRPLLCPADHGQCRPPGRSPAVHFPAIAAPASPAMMIGAGWSVTIIVRTETGIQPVRARESGIIELARTHFSIWIANSHVAWHCMHRGEPGAAPGRMPPSVDEVFCFQMTKHARPNSRPFSGWDL